MRTILGGTFDPVHLGHLGGAVAAGAALGVARVTLLLAARPWHRDAPQASVADRWAMLRMAVEDANAHRLPERGSECGSERGSEQETALAHRRSGAPRNRVPTLEASARERARPGPSYTVATLAEMGGGEPLVWLLGDDALAGVNRWHRADELAGLCHLLVLARPGRVAPERAPAPPPGFRRVASPDAFRRQPSGGIHYLPAAMMDISATGVRAGIARQEDTSALLSPRVWAYIRCRGLYGAARTHCAPHANRQGVAVGGAKSKRKI